MLKSLIIVHGTSNWTKIGESFPERTGKQCRERWYNHLDPHVKKGEWTPRGNLFIGLYMTTPMCQKQSIHILLIFQKGGRNSTMPAQGNR